MFRNTPIVIIFGLILVLASLCPGQVQQEAVITKKPILTDLRIVSLPAPTSDQQVTLELVIEGENLCNALNQPTVRFDTKDPAFPLRDVSVVSSSKREVRVRGTAKVDTEITRLVVVVGDEKAETPKEFSLSIKPTPNSGKLKQFEIKFDHQKNKEFPNLHSLVVTKESGEPDVGFATNSHWMTVDLVPTGATDLNIVQSNKHRLDLHFVAAPDYEPKSVAITVYNGSDLDKREPTAISIDKKAAAEDPDQPKITGTEIVFIEREQGMGRIRIYGKGFGDYAPPPYPLDEYVRNCAKRFRIEEIDPELKGKNRDRAMARREEDFKREGARFNGCVQVLAGEPKELDEIISKGGQGERQYEKLQYTNPVSYITGSKKIWADEQKVRENVTVAVNPRNPDIRVEKVEILNINDNMIDVYFEFERYRGYALPFRFADATVTIKKIVPKSTQTIKNDQVTAVVHNLKRVTFSVPYQPGPKRDPSLAYKFTVLDNDSADTLVGRGIADNFFVLQLSVVNNGEKKVAIPLSAIQAEVEWAARAGEKKEYRVGPATLPPVPLAAVSGYFDAYQKVKGKRALLFNVLDSATILATGLVPFTGPSFKDAALYFSGAAVPGARKAWGDLSGQQLQNLTALSWESSETLPAKGGSTEKLIYIPMRKELVGEVEEGEGIKKQIWKQVTNVTDVEVTGYEVVESEPKQAAPSSGKSSNAAAVAGTSSSATITSTVAPGPVTSTESEPAPTKNKTK